MRLFYSKWSMQCSAVFLALAFFLAPLADGFNIMDYSHYIDYLPYRVEGFAAGDDFRTSTSPPSQLRNRKMHTGCLKLEVEDVLQNPLWPSKWPYGFEDFRPLDYTRDDVINTAAQYEFSQR